MAIDIIKFGSNDIANTIAKLSPQEIDNLAFGAVQLDQNGDILMYNSAEAQIVGGGINPKDVIGKNFFKDVAPCTNTPQFYGKFKELIQNKELSIVFEYLFANSYVKATKVQIHMKKALAGNNYWIFVKRL